MRHVDRHTVRKHAGMHHVAPRKCDTGLGKHAMVSKERERSTHLLLELIERLGDIVLELSRLLVGAVLDDLGAGGEHGRRCKTVAKAGQRLDVLLPRTTQGGGCAAAGGGAPAAAEQPKAGARVLPLGARSRGAARPEHGQRCNVRTLVHGASGMQLPGDSGGAAGAGGGAPTCDAMRADGGRGGFGSDRR